MWSYHSATHSMYFGEYLYSVPILFLGITSSIFKSQNGSPPALTSALINGPGRAITYRPAFLASSKTFLTSFIPEKSYSPRCAL